MSSEKGVTPPWGTGMKKSVEGWIDAPSGTCGDQIGLHITGNRRPVTIKIIRATIPGQYLLRLEDKGHDSSFVPLTIVDPNIKSSNTFVSSVLTWQAYNQWGGYSLYKGPNMTRGTRATIVSFNCPDDGDGSGQFRYMEYPILKIAEQLGLDMNYITDFELAGNACYAHPRLPANGRQIVMWRSSTADPNRNNPILATTGRRQYPISQPEAKILGAQYVGLGVSGDYTIAHANRWPFTSMTHPSLLQSIVGRKVDSPLYSIGPAVEVLANSAIYFHGKAVTIMATYYTNSKKAGVIDISTNDWTCAIDDICPWRPAIIDIQARTKISALQRI